MGGNDDGLEERSGSFARPQARSGPLLLEAPSVLVVEDNPDLQWRLARTLTVEGYRVVGTSSSAGAVALLEQWSVDVAMISERIWHAPSSELLQNRLAQLQARVPLVLVSHLRHEAAPKSTLARAILRPPIQSENVRAALARALNPGSPSLLTAAPTG